jgi:hypothetical protein
MRHSVTLAGGEVLSVRSQGAGQRWSTVARSNLPLAVSVYAFPSEQMNGMRSKHRDSYKRQCVLQSVAQTIKQTHGICPSLEELMAAPFAPPSIGNNSRYGCFSFFAARAPAPVVSFSHM